MPPRALKAVAAGASAPKAATTATIARVFSRRARGRHAIRTGRLRATVATCQSLDRAAGTLRNLAPPPGGIGARPRDRGARLLGDLDRRIALDPGRPAVPRVDLDAHRS